MYVKVFTKILDSSIWLEAPATRLVWITLLTVMDEDGFAAFSCVENLARRANIDLEGTEKAVQCLEAPDPRSSDPSHEGRRVERVPGGWMVLNGPRYRATTDRDNERAAVRERVRRFRERGDGVTPGNTVTDHVTAGNPIQKQKQKQTQRKEDAARRADAPRQPRIPKAVGHPAVQACTDAFRVNLPAWKPAGRDPKLLVAICARNGVEVVSRWIQGPLWDHCQRFPYLERMGYGAAALVAQEHVLQKMDQDARGGGNDR